MKIHVAGKNADNIGNQCGGWSITWQGQSGSITKGTTILQGIKNAAGTSNITYSADGSGAAGSDIAIAVIGETPYAEGAGDRTDLSLSDADIFTVRNLKQANIPVIVVLVSGRPMLLNPILHFADAIIAAWLPGTEGEGVADILFGDYQPTGKLSYSWPLEMAQIPVNFGDAVYSPLYEYGYGLNSLANSAAGSSPVMLSSLTGNDAYQVEVTFNKAMNDPAGGASGFTVISNFVDLEVVKAELSPVDNTTIILTLAQPVNKGDVIELNYSGEILTSADGGILQSFAALVYNLLDENNAVILPGKIEAEDYINMSGIQTENCSDTGGGENVGWIETGDWMDYLVSVPADGKYMFRFRVAAQSAEGEIRVITGASALATLTLPVTGGWQSWQTVSANINLTKGIKQIRVYAGKGGFNLNWIDVSIVTGVEDNNSPDDFSLSQNYPNPFNPVTLINYNIAEKSNVKLSVYDILGKEIAVLINEEQNSGSYSVRFSAASFGLTSGTYFYTLRAGEFNLTRKMTILK